MHGGSGPTGLFCCRSRSGRKGPGLLARGDALIAELKAEGLDWGAASVRLHTARVLVRRHDIEAATARIDHVRVDATTPLSLRLLAHDVRAELATAQRRPAEALSHIRSGLTELHAWQSSFGSLDLQTMVVGHGTRLAGRGLAVAVACRDAGVLYEWSERARMLASRVQPVRVPADAQISDDLAELRKLTPPEDGVGCRSSAVIGASRSGPECVNGLGGSADRVR